MLYNPPKFPNSTLSGTVVSDEVTLNAQAGYIIWEASGKVDGYSFTFLNSHIKNENCVLILSCEGHNGMMPLEPVAVTTTHVITGDGSAKIMLRVPLAWNGMLIPPEAMEGPEPVIVKIHFIVLPM